MPFDPIKTGLWHRKQAPVDDLALTVVNLNPRIGILTFKVGDTFHDFLIGPDHAEEIAKLMHAMLEVSEDEAEALDESPSDGC